MNGAVGIFLISLFIYENERIQIAGRVREDRGAFVRVRGHEGHPAEHQTEPGGEPRDNQDPHQPGVLRGGGSEGTDCHMQVELLRMLSSLFAANSFNSLILAKRDREIM
jgi:hypothetical protein